MSKNVFKYPGAKTQMANWIIDKFPKHRTYVEVFGGSAAVLANKDKSKVEVYNDADGDLVHFFETLRDRADELKEWLAQTPYSRNLHERFVSEYYGGQRPDDDIERAGRFFYLRETQFAQEYTGRSGFSYQIKRNAASSYAKKVERLTEWQDRFRSVQIEQLDCMDLIERYDTPRTFFYCDPPYMDEGDELYTHDSFNHEEFVSTLDNTDGYWMISYTRVPEELREIATCIMSQERKVVMRRDNPDFEKTNTERLIMNYDPEKITKFAGANQETLF